MVAVPLFAKSNSRRLEKETTERFIGQDESSHSLRVGLDALCRCSESAVNGCLDYLFCCSSVVNIKLLANIIGLIIYFVVNSKQGRRDHGASEASVSGGGGVML